MTKTGRKKFTENTNIALVSEVNSICPKCNNPLMYSKANSIGKNYELAHIYPLNPKPHEEILLQHEELLHTDINNQNNLIALCLPCHNEFDNPRTVEEYREMVKLKKHLIQKKLQEKIIREYQIEEEISQVIDLLETWTDEEPEELSLIPKPLSEKLNETMPRLAQRQIKNNVTSYFSHIRLKLKLIETETPNKSKTISTQVKSFYLKQTLHHTDQEIIYKNTIAWLMSQTSASSEACEIIVSFFIQNCEIFE